MGIECGDVFHRRNCRTRVGKSGVDKSVRGYFAKCTHQMPIRRKKVDEETDEEEGISADVVPPPHNAGLGEELTKSPSLSYDVAPLIATVEAELDMAKNDAGVNEVSQMLAIALQQIDTVIEGMLHFDRSVHFIMRCLFTFHF